LEYGLTSIITSLTNPNAYFASLSTTSSYVVTT